MALWETPDLGSVRMVSHTFITVFDRGALPPKKN
jgi:hypothetical protein